MSETKLICAEHDTTKQYSWPPCPVCGYWKTDYKPEWQRKLAKPWAWCVGTISGGVASGEHVIFGDEFSCRDEVDSRNEGGDEDKPEYVVVPLFRAEAYRSDMNLVIVQAYTEAAKHFPFYEANPCKRYRITCNCEWVSQWHEQFVDCHIEWRDHIRKLASSNVISNPAC